MLAAIKTPETHDRVRSRVVPSRTVSVRALPGRQVAVRMPVVEPTERFAANMKRLRRERGYSQEGFALHAGLSRTEVIRLESGERNLKLLTIVKVAEGLGVPLPELLTGIGPQSRA